MAEMRLFTFDDTNYRPSEGLQYPQTVEGIMDISYELHDIVKERVMISQGAAFFESCVFGDTQVYLKTKAHLLNVL